MNVSKERIVESEPDGITYQTCDVCGWGKGNASRE